MLVWEVLIANEWRIADYGIKESRFSLIAECKKPFIRKVLLTVGKEIPPMNHRIFGRIAEKPHPLKCFETLFIVKFYAMNQYDGLMLRRTLRDQCC